MRVRWGWRRRLVEAKWWYRCCFAVATGSHLYACVRFKLVNVSFHDESPMIMLQKNFGNLQASASHETVSRIWRQSLERE
jgi:hypothetical protein